MAPHNLRKRTAAGTSEEEMAMAAAVSDDDDGDLIEDDDLIEDEGESDVDECCPPPTPGLDPFSHEDPLVVAVQKGMEAQGFRTRMVVRIGNMIYVILVICRAAVHPQPLPLLAARSVLPPPPPRHV